MRTDLEKQKAQKIAKEPYDEGVFFKEDGSAFKTWVSFYPKTKWWIGDLTGFPHTGPTDDNRELTAKEWAELAPLRL